MKKSILSIALLAIVAMACAQQKRVMAPGKRSPAPASTETINKTAVASGALNYISMQRTACFGKCPAYYIELYPDGLVRYHGQMFTTYEGTYEKNIGTAKTNAIFASFKKYQVDTCREDYNKYIQDLSNINYRFKFGSKEVKILHADFGPAYFKEMATKIDAVGQPDKSWKKTADATKR